MNHFGLFNSITFLCNGRYGDSAVLAAGSCRSFPGPFEGVSLSRGVCGSDSLPPAASKVYPFPPLSHSVLTARRRRDLSPCFWFQVYAHCCFIFPLFFFFGLCYLGCQFLLCLKECKIQMDKYFLFFANCN